MKLLKLVLPLVSFWMFSQSSIATTINNNTCDLDKSSRQTVVLLDSGVVQRGDLASNTVWTKAVLGFLGVGEISGGSTAPSEKINIFLLNRENGEMRLIFSGCSPNISDSAATKLKDGDSWFGDLLGNDSSSKIEELHNAFRSDVIRSFGDVIENARAQPVKGNLAESLAHFRGSIKLSQGIPRIFFVANMQELMTKSFADKTAAKKAGIDEGLSSGVDLARAEIYVTSVGAELAPSTQSYFEGFFLAAKGNLEGLGGGVPVTKLPPTVQHVYEGSVNFGDVIAPVQIRLAADAEGSLVNSWIEITAGRSIATPITGKLICQSNNQCNVEGDGRLFGQAWNPEVGGEPKFSPDFGWSGLRNFSMKILGNVGDVKIYDPSVQIIYNGAATQHDWTFKVTERPGREF